MENRSYGDKIEKRDEELQQLQNKVTSSTQLIAHMKEKSFAINEKINELCDMLEHTETQLISVSIPNGTFTHYIQYQCTFLTCIIFPPLVCKLENSK
jgi:hypothetical protein